MLPLLKMALRNIQRNRRRSLLAILSVGLSLMMVVVLQGLVDGLVENIMKNSTKNDTGHIRIVEEEYFKNISTMPIQYLVYNPEEVVAFLESDPKMTEKITLITERIKFPVLLQYKGNNKAALGIGGDVEKEKSLLMLDRAIVEGRYLSGRVQQQNEKKLREVIVGKKMAETLELKVGDSFSLMLSGADLGIHIPRFLVVGIFETGLNMLDENLFFLGIDDAKEVLKTSGGVQEILIMLKRYQEAPYVAASIEKKLKEREEFAYLRAVDWKSAGGFVGMLEQAMSIYSLLYVVITLLGAFIITNIMMMIVLERRREIGILKSMGLKKREILFLFTLEGTILGGIGSVAGVVVGTLINIPLAIYGLDFSSSLQNMNFPMDNVVKWMISAGSIVGSMFLGIMVSAIMSLIPSRHAAKMKAVDAIRSI